jgi:hypothetical protein
MTAAERYTTDSLRSPVYRYVPAGTDDAGRRLFRVHDLEGANTRTRPRALLSYAEHGRAVKRAGSPYVDRWTEPFFSDCRYDA